MHGAQLAPAGDAEVEGRADALGRQRQAVARRVAGEEDPVLGRAAQLVGDPVALVADRRPLQVLRQQHGRVLDVKAGVEGADADALLVAGRERPAVSGRDVAAVDPDLEVVAAALRMDLEAARKGRVRWLVPVGGEDSLPAERVDDQGRGQIAAVGVHDIAGATLHLGRLERRVGLLPEDLAELAVVEGGEGEGEPVAAGAVRGVHHQRVEFLPRRALQAQRVQPPGRDAAGRGLSLADLVAVDHEDVGARAGQLARDRQSGEAGAADEHVVIAGERQCADRRVLWHAWARGGR